ncbi:MAG: hypothetical protein L0206_05400 [Actinobacteria bacterium]|nr:hypothetical protein [Actinomycetota bacterium]
MRHVDEGRHLSAGPVQVELDGCDLWAITIDGLEIVDRVYLGVRDPLWSTLAGEILDLDVAENDHGFRVRFTVRHRARDIDLRWHGEIDGGADGTIRYAVEGMALRAFEYSRLGPCVLHPARTYAGRSFRTGGPNGEFEGVFPDLVAPQWELGGVLQPMVPAFREMDVEFDSCSTRFEYRGDLVEMEDQRNWIDGTLKTYSRPLSEGPGRTVEGERLFNEVRITVEASGRSSPSPTGRAAPPPGRRDTIHMRDRTMGRLPRIGLRLADSAVPLADIVRLVRPDHLRVDADSDRRDSVASIARSVGVELEVGLRVADLANLPPDIEDDAIARVLLFGDAVQVPTADEVTAAERWCADRAISAPLAVATKGDFAELNRATIDASATDVVAFGANPQRHAADRRSILGCLRGLEDAVATARARWALPVVVSPLTVDASWGGYDPPPSEHLFGSLFGAGWVVGAIAAIAAGGGLAVTVADTEEPSDASPHQAAILSASVPVAPVFHVLADLIEMSSGRRLEVAIAGEALSSVATRGRETVDLLVANHRPAEREVRIVLPPVGSVRVRRLGDADLTAAGAHADAFRLDRWTDRSGHDLDLRLGPHEIVRIQSRIDSIS